MIQPEPSTDQTPAGQLRTALSTALYDEYIEVTYDFDWGAHGGSCRVCEDWCVDDDKDGVKAAADQHITEVHVRTATDAEPIIRRAVAEEIASAIEADLQGEFPCAWTRTEAAAIARDHGEADV
jgi:hypothetical protein